MNTRNTEQSSTPGLPGRRWVTVAGILAGLFLVLLVVAPYIMSWTLKSWLQDHGADQVEIHDIDFNPFAGVAVVEVMNVRVGEQDTLVIPRLLLDLDWLPLFSRQVYVRAVTLDGVEVNVVVDKDGAVKIGGVDLATGESTANAGKPWDFGIAELNIRNSTLDYRDPVIEVNTGITGFNLKELTTWATTPAPVTFTGTVNGAAVRIDGQMPPLSEGYGFDGKLKVDGLSLAAFEQLAAPAVNGLTGRVMLDTDLSVTYREDRPLLMKQDGLLRLDELQIKQAENSIGYTQLQWQGAVSASLADEPDISTGGVLKGNGLVVDLPGEGARLQLGNLAWEGKAGFSGSEDGDVQASGRLRLERTMLDPADGRMRLINIDEIELRDLALQAAGVISIDGIAVNGATFAQTVGKDGGSEPAASEASPLQVASIAINSLRVTDGNRVAIESMDVRDAHYVARRNEDGRWRMVTILESVPFAGEKEQKDAKPGSLHIGTLKIHDGSTLTMQDYDVSPPFRKRFNIEEFVNKDFDSANPGQVSHMQMKGNFTGHDRIVISGTWAPLATPVILDLDATIEGLELPPFSPYSIDSIGYRMDSGQMDSDSSIQISKGKLHGANKLTMRGVQMTPVEGEQLEKMEKQLALPLNKGLDMLRDDHDVIRLDLPVTGDIDAPDFDVSDAINQAVARAAREGAIASLTLLLQPYGSLVTVARYAAEKVNEIRLDPVLFRPASAEVDEARHEYLDKVAGIIKQRPNINIRLCGVATNTDREALLEKAAAENGKDKKKPPEEAGADTRLRLLADQRDAAVKDYLVSRHEISPGRLVACQPAIDAGEDAEPRVDLLI